MIYTNEPNYGFQVELKPIKNSNKYGYIASSFINSLKGSLNALTGREWFFYNPNDGRNNFYTDTLQTDLRNIRYKIAGTPGDLNHSNIFIGTSPLVATSSSLNTTSPSAQSSNVVIGVGSGISLTEGSYNTFLGSYAGYRNTEGSYNIIIRAGGGGGRVNAKTIKLCDDNDYSSKDTECEYGTRPSGSLLKNKKTLYALNLNKANQTNNKTIYKRLKKNITPLNLKKSALNTIKDLKTYQFYWKNKKEYGKGPQLGLIAQEVKKILPQVVRKKDNLLNINYSQLSVVTLQAVKDLYSLFNLQINNLKLKTKNLRINFKTLLKKEINKLKIFVKNIISKEMRVLWVEVKNQTQKMKDIKNQRKNQIQQIKELKRETANHLRAENERFKKLEDQVQNFKALEKRLKKLEISKNKVLLSEK